MCEPSRLFQIDSSASAGEKGILMGKYLGAIICNSALIYSAAVAAEVLRWDLADEQSATSLAGEASLLFAKLVNEESGGRIDITVHSGGSLGFRSEQHLDLVGDGAVPLANTPPHHLGGYAAIFNVGSLPFLTKTSEHARILLEVAAPAYQRALEVNNQILISAGPWPPSGFWSDRPIKTVEDIKNWKLRVFDVNSQTTMVAAGAAPVQLSWADIAPALSTGSIHGVLTSAQAGASSHFWDFTSYFTEINYALPLNMIHMNLDVWQSLPPDLKEIVVRAGKEVTDTGFARVRTQVARDYALMEANGVTIITEPSPALIEHLKYASLSSYDRWQRRVGPQEAGLLIEYRRRIGEANH